MGADAGYHNSQEKVHIDEEIYRWRYSFSGPSPSLGFSFVCKTVKQRNKDRALNARFVAILLSTVFCYKL